MTPEIEPEIRPETPIEEPEENPGRREFPVEDPQVEKDSPPLEAPTDPDTEKQDPIRID